MQFCAWTCASTLSRAIIRVTVLRRCLSQSCQGLQVSPYDDRFRLSFSPVLNFDSQASLWSPSKPCAIPSASSTALCSSSRQRAAPCLCILPCLFSLCLVVLPSLSSCSLSYSPATTGRSVQQVVWTIRCPLHSSLTPEIFTKFASGEGHVLRPHAATLISSLLDIAGAAVM